MFYSFDRIRSYNAIWNFIISNRGGGKTFACQKWCIKDFIKNGNKFIWLRRYGSEVDEIKGKWCSNALIQQFPDNEISFNGKKILVDKKEAGIIMALSTS